MVGLHQLCIEYHVRPLDSWILDFRAYRTHDLHDRTQRWSEQDLGYHGNRIVSTQPFHLRYACGGGRCGSNHSGECNLRLDGLGRHSGQRADCTPCFLGRCANGPLHIDWGHFILHPYIKRPYDKRAITDSSSIDIGSSPCILSLIAMALKKCILQYVNLKTSRLLRASNGLFDLRWCFLQ